MSIWWPLFVLNEEGNGRQWKLHAATIHRPHDKSHIHRLIASTSGPHCNESHLVEMVIPEYMLWQTLPCSKY